MPVNRFYHALSKLNVKYFVLAIPFVIFFLFSTVFSGYAAPISSEASNFSKLNAKLEASTNQLGVLKSTPAGSQSTSKIASTAVPHTMMSQTSMLSSTLIFLPVIFKGPAYQYSPDGFLLIPVLYWAPPAQSAAVNTLVTLTPPLPTVSPGATPVPTTGPGTPTHTPTPKASLTPTPTNTPAPVLISNGDFEAGDDGWREFSLRGHDLFFDKNNDALPKLPISPVSGNWAVWLGGDDSELSYIEREVRVPFDRPFLTHKYYIQSYDPICATDLFSDFTVRTQFIFATASTLNSLQSDVGGLIILVNGNVGGVVFQPFDLCSSKQTGGWGTVVYDTSFYRGQVVTIRFKTIGDSQATSSWFIDDVGFRADFFLTTGQDEAQPLLLDGSVTPPSSGASLQDLVQRKNRQDESEQLIRKSR